MRCPTCGNQVYERLDYAIVRCTVCMSLWDPYVYPGLPEPNVDIGELWDTTESVEFDWMQEESEEDDPDELEDADDLDEWDYDDEDDEYGDEFEDEPDDWDAEDD